MTACVARPGGRKLEVTQRRDRIDRAAFVSVYLRRRYSPRASAATRSARIALSTS